jgi:fructose-1,6-bisphosphatase
MYILPTMALKRGRQKKGTAKHKGAKGQSYKINNKINKIKTKAKTINRNIDKRRQRVAIAKATRTNIEVDRNKDADEAAPSATQDTETISES